MVEHLVYIQGVRGSSPLPPTRTFLKMKIVICASVAFSKEIVETKDELVKLGHEVVIPENVEEYAAGKRKPETWQELAERKIEGDLIRGYFEEIKNSDAVLILNYDKNGTRNYIGGNSFLEMGFAHVLQKPIYILNPIPEMAYRDEIAAMKPNILDGDLSGIVEK